MKVNSRKKKDASEGAPVPVLWLLGDVDFHAGFEFKGEVVVADRHPLKEPPGKILVVIPNRYQSSVAAVHIHYRSKTAVRLSRNHESLSDLACISSISVCFISAGRREASHISVHLDKLESIFRIIVSALFPEMSAASAKIRKSFR